MLNGLSLLVQHVEGRMYRGKVGGGEKDEWIKLLMGHMDARVKQDFWLVIEENYLANFSLEHHQQLW